MAHVDKMKICREVGGQGVNDSSLNNNNVREFIQKTGVNDSIFDNNNTNIHPETGVDDSSLDFTTNVRPRRTTKKPARFNEYVCSVSTFSSKQRKRSRPPVPPTAPTPRPCTHCGRTVGSRALLRRHVQLEHRDFLDAKKKVRQVRQKQELLSFIREKVNSERKTSMDPPASVSTGNFPEFPTGSTSDVAIVFRENDFDHANPPAITILLANEGENELRSDLDDRLEVISHEQKARPCNR